jgi:tyrosine-protein kinase Etk/Wzc
MIESHNVDSKNIDLKEIISKYKSFWKYYIVSVLLCFIIGYFYLSFKENMFVVQSTILVKDDENGGVSSEISAFQDLGIGLGLKSNNIDNVIEVLKSRYLIEKVISENKLNITYYKKSRFQNIELPLNKKSITINIIKDTYNKSNQSIALDVDFLSKERFNLTINGNKIYNLKFGQKIQNKLIGEFVLTPTSNKFFDKNVKIIIYPISLAIKSFQTRFSAEKINKESNALTISLKCQNIENGKLFVNELIKKHTEDEVEDKNRVAKNTIVFINERIKFITEELSSVENNVSSFKSKNDFFDLNENANIFFENQSSNQKELFENETQIKLSEFIYNDTKSKNIFDLVPANIGINDITIEKSIESINNLLLERNKVASSSSEKNPVVVNLDNQIKNLKSNLNLSLKNFINSLKIKNKALINLNNKISSKLNNAPKQEKDFREILRQQQIKETLYLYLLQKREQTSISYAVAISNTKVLDNAFSDEIPISPNRKMILLSSILLGIIFPTLLIYLKFIFDTKIHSKDDLSHLQIPIVGDLPLVKEMDTFIINKGDRSSIAEAFRILRTNINFFLNKAKSNCKTVFVTSTFSSEGKSFVSINLASSIAMTQKRVLLIGVDLRLPKLLEYIGEQNSKGVSNYVIDKNLSFDDVVIKSKKLEGVDIIPSGIIPPNPSELLLDERVHQLFDSAKEKYDYIIVDTAPVGLVTDTLLIKDFADLTVFVTRANVLEKKALSILNEINDNKKLNNIAILVNGIDYDAGYGYGKGYGYGHYVSQPNQGLIQKIFKKIKFK